MTIYIVNISNVSAIPRILRNALLTAVRWCQQIKTDFTFEYQHLEDELWVPINSNI
jgi:hypothetical protein